MNKKERKILIRFLPLIMAGWILISAMPAANACKIFGIDVGGSDVCEDEGDGGESGSLSFQDYQVEGGLTGLQSSEEDLDSSLTSEGGDLKKFILRVVNYALGFLGLLAVLMVIYGGVLYVTSGGQSEQADKGKKNILYATIGLIIVMGSFALVNTVIKAGGGTDGTGGGAGSSAATRNAESFNAAAQQVSAITRNMYNGFIFMTEVTEELKSIQSDVQKKSLAPVPGNPPAKQDIISFLTTTKSKIERVKSNVPKFSQSEAYANVLIRDIEQDLDYINELTKTAWIKPSMDLDTEEE
ncbi:MAG: pilin, partial [Candidatus Gracilibacteria bacterium]